MAPVIKPATNQSIDFSDLNQLKRKSEEDIDQSLGFETFSQDEDEDDEEGDDSLALKRTTKKTGDHPVSKRTLQNRKAQREFRKRREARVRELEERCRRFDQMGLEANGELQRAARGLKEENDALRGFIMRMGFGNMIPNLLQDSNNQRNGDDQFYQQNQQPTFSGGMFGNVQPNSAPYNEPTFFIDPSSAVQSANATMNQGRGRSHTVGNGNEQHRSSSSSSNNSNQIDAEKMAGGIRMPMPLQYGNMTLAPTPQPVNMRSGISQRSGSGAQSQEKPKSGQSSSPSSAKSAENGDTPFLTLNLNNSSRHQDGKQSQSDNQQSQPQFTQSKQDNDANNAGLNGLGSLFGGTNNNGMGSGGTAMLQNFNNSFPVPQRSRQNAALLNPNPIPFSFNLNSGDLASQNPTWWEQMGGGSEQIELDDKAQAVANAQQGANQAPSPFDLSAFLQGGITPGGGFQFGNVGGSQAGSQPNSMAISNEMGRTGSLDSDHMRMFIQLMERKMAERDACTFASLGFQPPSQDPAQRSKNEQQQEIASQMTPSGVYSRLAQHPAFLSTNAREMEELMDALGPSTWNRQDEKSEENGNSKDETKDSTQDRRSSEQDNNSSKDNKSRSNSASSLTPGKVHVDENAIGKLMGLLDQKRNSNAKSFTTDPSHEDNQQRFTMSMT